MNQLFKRNGKPFFVLGGQAHNSTTYSAYDRGMFWKALDALNGNTAEIPVYWEAVEPQEDLFDFSTVDQLLQEAREHGKSLVLLWFGTWKNGNMRYAPAWVKKDPKRFRRVRSHDGNELFVLSSHYRENLEEDKKAFCRFLEHLNTADTDGTVIAVQVENEAGIAGRSYRDFSENGESDYLAPVPEGLLQAIEAAPGSDLFHQWEARGFARGKNWGETFGVKNGSENLTAYSIASYINEIARAGKKVSTLPLYTNVALDRNPWGWNLPGTNYTAGGPIPRLYEIWKYAAPELDMLAPDIYFDCRSVYEQVCTRYSNGENALFIPESGTHAEGGNDKNLFYAIGKYGAVGYAAFGIENILDAEGNPDPAHKGLIDSFRSVSSALPLLGQYRLTGKVHTVVQEEHEGGYFYETEKYIVKIEYPAEGYSNYIHKARKEPAGRGRGLVIEAAADEFYVLGTNFVVYFAPKDDLFYSEDRVTNHMPYLSVEEGCFTQDGTWRQSRIRTGDECDHGIWVFPENGTVRVVLCD